MQCAEGKNGITYKTKYRDIEIDLLAQKNHTILQAPVLPNLKLQTGHNGCFFGGYSKHVFKKICNRLNPTLYSFLRSTSKLNGDIDFSNVIVQTVFNASLEANFNKIAKFKLCRLGPFCVPHNPIRLYAVLSNPRQAFISRYDILYLITNEFHDHEFTCSYNDENSVLFKYTSTKDERVKNGIKDGLLFRHSYLTPNSLCIYRTYTFDGDHAYELISTTKAIPFQLKNATKDKMVIGLAKAHKELETNRKLVDELKDDIHQLQSIPIFSTNDLNNPMAPLQEDLDWLINCGHVFDEDLITQIINATIKLSMSNKGYRFDECKAVDMIQGTRYTLLKEIMKVNNNTNHVKTLDDFLHKNDLDNFIKVSKEFPDLY